MAIHPLPPRVNSARDLPPIPTSESIDNDFVAFPSEGHGDDTHASGTDYWDGRSPQPTHRTVRRKKSSFDLRYVFKNGAAPASNSVVVL